MKTKIYLFILSICVACNNSNKQESNDILEQDSVSIITNETPNVIIESEMPTDTVEFIPTKHFSANDWNNVKQAFQQWRKQEIAKGNFAESCFGNPVEFMEKETSDARYSLPNIPKAFNDEFDSCMVDVNLDGKQDVLFKIRPLDCLEGSGTAAHPPLYISVVSSGDNYKIDNTCISKVETAIKDYRKKLSNWEYQWIQIDSIRNDKGIIVISGNSTIYLEDDISCCPSIELNFIGYIDTENKGHIDITGKKKEKEFKDRLSVK